MATHKVKLKMRRHGLFSFIYMIWHIPRQTGVLRFASAADTGFPRSADHEEQ